MTPALARACESNLLAWLSRLIELRRQQRSIFVPLLFALALTASFATLLTIASTALAQTDTPDAPTDVAVYVYGTQKLEVRWSTADASNTTSFKVQWKSGTEDFDTTRQLTSDPATSIVSEQSTTAGDRYVATLTGLTDATEYTVQVLATNANGDSDASDAATGTPKSFPDDAEAFIENEVIEIFEDSHSWLRETWDYITAQNVPVAFNTATVFAPADQSYVLTSCSNIPDTTGLRKCKALRVNIYRSEANLIYTITHELAHVYLEANGVASTPGPLGIARLYFYDLISPPGLGGRSCLPSELYAEALAIVTHGDAYSEQVDTYFDRCDVVTSAVSVQALAVVRSAVAGDMPSWFDDTYDDSNGDPVLGRVWGDINAVNEYDRTIIVYQLRNSFGGYCANATATASAFGSGKTRNPWNDGGCVPGVPRSVSATLGSYLWSTVSWQEPVDDGGSAIKGYKIQWKNETQEYDSSRQEVVTDLIFRDNRKFSFLVKTIWLSGYYQPITIRVLAYNQNGDGAATEYTVTPAYSTTETTAPQLLRAQLWHDLSAVRLIYNEALDSSSSPSRTAFAVYVNGVETGRAGLSSSVWDEANKTHIVSFSFWKSGGVQPGDTVTVSYTAPGGEGAKPIKDAAGNLAAEFSHFPVHNDRTTYAITSDPGTDNTYTLNSGAGDQDFIEATVTFGEPVEADGAPELRLAIGGVGTTVWRRMPYHSGTGTSSLVFRYYVQKGDLDKNGILLSYTGALATDHGVVRYVSTGAEAPAWIGGDHHLDHRVDGVPPTLVSADILADGTGLDLRWSENMDEGSIPSTSDPGFEVRDTSDNSARTINAISIDGSVVTLTLSAAVSATHQLEVLYEVPSTNPIKDALGNYAGRIREGQFETGPKAVSVTLSANSPPEFPSTEDGARSVDENTAAGSNIGSPIAATDADSDTRTYSISGEDAASFEVVSTSGQLRTREALDFETTRTYSFTMSVHDGVDVHGNADTTTDDTITVTVTVNDADDPPRITGPTYKEYREGGMSAVATYSAADQDEPATLWDLTLTGDDSDDLTLSSAGVLTFNQVPDFENPTDANGDGRYQVTVNAAEQGGSRTLSQDVTVWVWNKDEGASFPSAPTTWKVGYEIDLDLVDLDGIYRIVEWRWERSPNQTDWTAIKGAYSSSYTPTTDDANHWLRISVYYHDNHQWGKGFHYTSPLVQEIFSTPETPLAPNVSAGGTTSLVVTWSAPQAYPAITGYAVRHRESDTTDPWTEVDIAAGALSHTIDDLTSGTSYDVQVLASNTEGSSTWSQPGIGTPRTVTPPRTNTGGGGGFGPAPVAPKFAEGFGAKRDLAQNAKPGDAIGDPVSATHPDDLDITYSLSGADAQHFNVDEETGHLSMKEGMEPVVGNTYTVNLTATDSAGFGAIIIVTIEIVEPAHHPYDANANGVIERGEVISAVKDYFDGELTKEEVIDLIKLYFTEDA